MDSTEIKRIIENTFKEFWKLKEKETIDLTKDVVYTINNFQNDLIYQKIFNSTLCFEKKKTDIQIKKYIKKIILKKCITEDDFKKYRKYKIHIENFLDYKLTKVHIEYDSES